MATSDDIRRVNGNIRGLYEGRRVYLYALSLAYAGSVLRRFRAQQPAIPGQRGKYWTNRTGQAAARVFTDAFRDEDSVGWRISHGVDYGVYLELANDRKHEALRPLAESFGLAMIKRVRDYYGG